MDRIRPRRNADLPALEQVLAEQQPESGYPFSWPLSYPARDFIVRAGEKRALVAVKNDRPIGHVSITAVQAGELGDIWAAGAGRPIDQISCLSVLFVDHRLQGKGVGGALLRAAESWIFEQGHTAVLDVIQSHSNALAVYLHRGWRDVGRARPEWLPESEPDVILMAKEAMPAKNTPRD